MLDLPQRGQLRWKEWIPLVSQQLRLRSIIQIIAFNIKMNEKDQSDHHTYYYTLHLKNMSDPFYISEKRQNENPKWDEIEFVGEIGSINAFYIRLWSHNISKNEVADILINTWALDMNFLIYLGQKVDCKYDLRKNSLIFVLPGGYFTASHCLKAEKIENPRMFSTDVKYTRNGYDIKKLLRFQSLQLDIKRKFKDVSIVCDKILAGGVKEESKNFHGAGKTLRRLLNENKPKRPPPEEVFKVKKDLENVKFRVELLRQEKLRLEEKIKYLRSEKEKLILDCEIKNDTINKNKESVEATKDEIVNKLQKIGSTKELLTDLKYDLNIRRNEIMQELSFIFPITIDNNGKYYINEVFLPHATNYEGVNDSIICVSLGYVCQVVLIISHFLNVPLIYPLQFYGSRSSIINRITDNEKEHLLYNRNKDKIMFDKGVYFLNKNIAELRWHYGLNTDLACTLPNIQTLLSPKI